MRRVPLVVMSALGVVVVLESALLALLVARDRWRARAEGTAVVRGQAVAARAGCFGCHGPGGGKPIPNPGAKGGEVPSWTGGTWMMWNKKEEDVRAWIVDGHPPGRERDRGALIAMPAYGEKLSKGEVDDLVAYVLAVSQFGWPDDPQVVAGREVAVKFGCFGCHGPEGRGLVANPGSFKGYIPPWDGEDYTDLVRDDREFREWVRQGISDRFKANPAARHFLETQSIPMPAFGDRIGDEEMSALLAYVRWVRENPRGGEPR